MPRKKKEQPDKGAEMTMEQWNTICQTVYACYPRKIARKAAYDAIRRAYGKVSARKDVIDPLLWLVERVQKFAAACNGRDRQYVPHASTWFNQERYDDDDAEWEAWKAAAAGRTLEGDVAPGLVEKRRKMDKAEQERIRRELREAF